MQGRLAALSRLPEASTSSAAHLLLLTAAAFVFASLLELTASLFPCTKKMSSSAEVSSTEAYPTAPMIAVLTAFMALSTLAVALRLWSRTVVRDGKGQPTHPSERVFWWDDWFAVASLVSFKYISYEVEHTQLESKLLRYTIAVQLVDRWHTD